MMLAASGFARSPLMMLTASSFGQSPQRLVLAARVNQLHRATARPLGRSRCSSRGTGRPL
jgi:hypothetical protein